jgi:membrane protein
MTAYSRLKGTFDKTLHYFKEGIWETETRGLSIPRRISIHMLRICYMTAEPLFKDEIHMRASSLTFFSLLSIVPVLAMLFGLAKGFGMDRLLEQSLLSRVQGQEAVFMKMIEFAKNLLESTKGGVVAGVGVIVLFWSVIKIFGNIEKNFNQIWGVAAGRPFLRKITDYLSLSLLCTVLAAGAGALTVMISSEATSIAAKMEVLAALSPAIFALIKLLPVVVLWIVFTLIYMLMPNTTVRFTSALIAGLVAGSAFQIFQLLYIHFQIGVAKYNAIYGSFAALPLFLVWLQLSWLIVLVGAHLSFAYQNADRFQLASDPCRLSPRCVRLLALQISSLVVKRFCSGEKPMGEKEISRQLKISAPVARDLLEKLTVCGVLSRLQGDSHNEKPYQPALDTHHLSIHFVMARLDRFGLDDLPAMHSESFQKLSSTLDQFGDLVASSPANLLLKDL